MKRSTKLVVGITTAAITFASLMAFTGKRHNFMHHGNRHYGYDKSHDCRKGEGANKDKPEETQENKTVVADSAKTGH